MFIKNVKSTVFLIFVVMIVIIVTFGVYGCKQEPKEQKWKLKMHAFYPATFAVYTAYDYWAKEVEKRTNGRVTFEKYPGAALFTEKEELDALKDGLIDVATLLIHSVSARIPAVWAPILLGVSDAQWIAMTTEVMEAGPAKELEDKFNIKFLYSFSGYPNDAVQHKDRHLYTLEDIRKAGAIRTAPGFWTEFAVAVGVDAVSMPISEMYDATARGVVKGSWTNIAGWSPFGLNETIPYVTLNIPCAGGRTAYMLSLNLDTWNSLPPDVQEIMMSAGREANLLSVSLTTRQQLDFIAAITTKGGRMDRMSDEEAKKILDLGMPVIWEKYLKEAGAAGQKVKTIVEKYAAMK
jgi:TRAP-type C4-dicarboxylate transport system substrate-binding protein